MKLINIKIAHNSLIFVSSNLGEYYEIRSVD